MERTAELDGAVEGRAASALRPVLDHQAADTLEFTHVVGDEDGCDAECVACDERTERADFLALFLQHGANLRRMVAGSGIERQYVEHGAKSADVVQRLVRCHGFVGTAQKLEARDLGDAHLLVMCVEDGQHMCRAPVDDLDAELVSSM